MRDFLTTLTRRSALLLAFICCSVSANTCRVTTGGINVNDGSTWSTPMDLKTALTTATCTEIWVAAGVYKPTADTNRNISFVIGSGVAVYGGFAGGETQRAQRNLGLNVTRLSADIGVIGSMTDNSYNIVVMNATAVVKIMASTILDGFTISDGRAIGGSRQGGAGLYCNGSGSGNECSPTLANLVFENNYSYQGGAVYNDGSAGGASNPTITNVTFTGNRSVNGGGAMYNYGYNAGTSSPVLSGVTFTGNNATGENGGAIYNDANHGTSSPTLTNVTLSGNSAAVAGGAIYNYGTLGVSNPTLNNVTLSGNSTPGYGGAIYSTAATSSSILSNVIMWGNTVSAGGAEPEIYNASGATATITSSIMEGGCPTGCTCVGLIATDPLLGVLQDNGGPTQTMFLTAGSSAINAGYNPTCAATDQRGVPRPQGPNCDIGAVEVVLDRIFADNFDGRPTP